jgi:hypothetical protein
MILASELGKIKKFQQQCVALAKEVGFLEVEEADILPVF